VQVPRLDLKKRHFEILTIIFTELNLQGLGRLRNLPRELVDEILSYIRPDERLTFY
jgi:hypothetical protein